MSLNFNVTHIADYNRLYPPTKEGNWNETTRRIVWLMLAIEMTKITVENAREAYTRMHAWECGLYGDPVTSDGGANIAYDDVLGHVGLSTNVFPQMSRARFEAKLGKAVMNAWTASANVNIATYQSKLELAAG
jgi:hypothetical protein